MRWGWLLCPCSLSYERDAMSGSMTGRERVRAAMAHREPDRVPVMCQLALGHYFLHGGCDPADIWFDSRTFAATLETLRARYGFDGFLLKGNLDAVNEMLRADDATFDAAVIERLRTGKPGSGYILSSACSVAPHVNPERLRRMVALAERHGRYAR